MTAEERRCGLGLREVWPGLWVGPARAITAQILTENGITSLVWATPEVTHPPLPVSIWVTGRTAGHRNSWYSSGGRGEFLPVSRFLTSERRHREQNSIFWTTLVSKSWPIVTIATRDQRQTSSCWAVPRISLFFCTNPNQTPGKDGRLCHEQYINAS